MTVAFTTNPVKDRIFGLDVVRGASILGILMANIASFSHPIFAERVGAQLGGAGEYDASLYSALITALVAGKFRGMLAILFGIGLMLQFQRREQAGEEWPGTYLRRTLLLAGLGLIHGLFIWHGDILLTYAITGFIMMWFAKSCDKTLGWIIGIGLACGFGLGLLTVLGEVLGNLGGSSSSPSLSSPPGLQMFNMWLSPEGEIRVYTQGTYLQQTLHRFGVLLISGMSNIVILPYFGALFAAGMLIARRRPWEQRESFDRLLKKGMLFGFGIGLPLNLLSIVPTLAGQGLAASTFVEVFCSAFLSVGYLSLLSWLALVIPKAMKPFAAVGRTALSCYLLTSLAATTVYYSWGFGLFGKTSHAQNWQIIAGIWALLVVLALLWTRFFEYGPVEWLWRSASSKEKLTFRRAASP